LTWGDESDQNNAKFKEVVLPPGMLDLPRDDVLGVTRSEPKVEPANSAPRGPRHQIDPAAGTETWKRKVRPRHREVVRKYFDSE
jgi:hypothetical protein